MLLANERSIALVSRPLSKYAATATLLPPLSPPFGSLRMFFHTLVLHFIDNIRLVYILYQRKHIL